MMPKNEEEPLLETNIRLFLNVGLQGRVNNLNGLFCVADAETIGDMISVHPYRGTSLIRTPRPHRSTIGA